MGVLTVTKKDKNGNIISTQTTDLSPQLKPDPIPRRKKKTDKDES